jgi:hypothetical protein
LAIFWSRFLAALAAVIFGVAGCLHRPYWLAIFGIVLGLFGMLLAVKLYLDGISERIQFPGRGRYYYSIQPPPFDRWQRDGSEKW